MIVSRGRGYLARAPKSALAITKRIKLSKDFWRECHVLTLGRIEVEIFARRVGINNQHCAVVRESGIALSVKLADAIFIVGWRLVIAAALSAHLVLANLPKYFRAALT